jgi:hypothetical protein
MEIWGCTTIGGAESFFPIAHRRAMVPNINLRRYIGPRGYGLYILECSQISSQFSPSHSRTPVLFVMG